MSKIRIIMRFICKIFIIFLIIVIAQNFSSYAANKKKHEVIKIETEFGDIVIWLYPETPKHKANFLKLAKEGFYNGIIFHRIINNFMIQGGDPTSKGDNKGPIGNGGPGYTIPAEFLPELIHKKGAVAAARMGDNVNPKRESSGSQFYIVQGTKFTEAQLANMKMPSGKKYSAEQMKVYSTIGGTPHLDGAYTVFGEVISGMEVVDKIAVQKTAERNKPVQDIKMDVSIFSLTSKKLKKNYNYIVK